MAKKIKPLAEIAGHGSLYIGGNGQGLNCLSADETVSAQRPGRTSGFDTAHVSRYTDTDFIQWYGRKSDGMFHPWGKIMKLTPAGKKAIKAEEAATAAKMAEARANQAAAQPEHVE
jgi:hypothetical protein